MNIMQKMGSAGVLFAVAGAFPEQVDALSPTCDEFEVWCGQQQPQPGETQSRVMWYDPAPEGTGCGEGSYFWDFLACGYPGDATAYAEWQWCYWENPGRCGS